jgi:AraC-like DNA-binding protein
MSPGNFSRSYRTKTGRTPAKALELFQVEAARRLLEEAKLDVDQIAAKSSKKSRAVMVTDGIPGNQRESFGADIPPSPEGYFSANDRPSLPRRQFAFTPCSVNFSLISLFV